MSEMNSAGKERTTTNIKGIVPTTDCTSLRTRGNVRGGPTASNNPLVQEIDESDDSNGKTNTSAPAFPKVYGTYDGGFFHSDYQFQQVTKNPSDHAAKSTPIETDAKDHGHENEQAAFAALGKSSSEDDSPPEPDVANATETESQDADTTHEDID